jgi:hypothetical protein
MQKKINIIVYMPGYAGRFLMGILSLDRKSMMPVAGTTYDTRMDRWTFKDLHHRYGSWYEHHRHLQYDFVGTAERFLKNLSTNCLTVAMHPREFFRDKARFDTLKHNAQVNFFHVDLAESHQWIIKKFQQDNPWPAGSGQTWYHAQDSLSDARYLQEYNPWSIDLAMIMAHEQGFLSQYHSIIDRAGMIRYDDLAIREYHHWRQARGLNDIDPGELARLAGEVGIEPTTG